MSAPQQPSLPIEDQAQPRAIEVEGHLFNLRQLAAVALLGTAVATGAANYFNGQEGRPEMPAIDITWGGHGTDAGHRTEGPSSSRGHGAEPTTAENSSTQTETLSDTMEEQWARTFAKDEKAGKLIDPTEISTFAGRVKDAVSEGWTLAGMKVRGQASAEDDSVDAQGHRTAGLQETDASAAVKQAELGDQRRNTGTLELAVALADQGVTISPSQVELLPSIEDVLDNNEVATIDALASQFGYANHTTMIEQWNRTPEKSPPAVDEALTEMLAKARTFQVEIDLTRPAVTVGTHHPTPEHPKGHPASGNGSQHDIRFFPIVIPGYFLIRANRRRRPTVTPEPTPDPYPPVPEPLPAVVAPVQPPRGRTPEVVVDDPPVDIPRRVRTPRTQFARPTSDPRVNSRTNQPAYTRKQPRDHNMSKGQRMSRSSGGNRSAKRVNARNWT